MYSLDSIPEIKSLSDILDTGHAFRRTDPVILSLTYFQAVLGNPNINKIAFKDMGSFLGTLLVRSFKRSSEVYNAMKCRGFDVRSSYLNYETFKIENYFLLVFCKQCTGIIL